MDGVEGGAANDVVCLKALEDIINCVLVDRPLCPPLESRAEFWHPVVTGICGGHGYVIDVDRPDTYDVKTVAHVETNRRRIDGEGCLRRAGRRSVRWSHLYRAVSRADS